MGVWVLVVWVVPMQLLQYACLLSVMRRDMRREKILKKNIVKHDISLQPDSLKHYMDTYVFLVLK